MNQRHQKISEILYEFNIPYDIIKFIFSYDYLSQLNFILKCNINSINRKSINILPDGRIVSGYDTLKIWNTENGNCEYTSDNISYITIIKILSDLERGSYRIVSGSEDGSLRIWNIIKSTSETTCQLILYGHTNSITAIEILPDGRLVSGSRDGKLNISNLANGISEQIGHPGNTGHTGHGIHTNCITDIKILSDLGEALIE